MQTREVTIINPTGLHARPASEFVKMAASFSSAVKVKNLKTNQEVNAKSIVLLMTLALSQGTPIVISAEGADEAEAVNALVELIEGGFGEC